MRYANEIRQWFWAMALVLGMNMAGAYAAEPGLVGWWKLDEKEGVVARDSSGNGLDAETSNALWVKGKDGEYGLKFRALNRAYMLLPDDARLNPTNAFTVEAWVKPMKGDLSIGAEAYIFALNYAWAPKGGLGIALFTIGTPYGKSDHDKFQLEVGNGARRICLVKDKMILDSWYHFAATYDGQMVKLFINGDCAGSAPLEAPIIYRHEENSIGDSNGTASFNGMIREVRIYNRALNPDEVKGQYCGGNPAQKP